MTSIETIIELNIKNGEDEIRDLKKFWGDISWWERDEALNSAMGWINLTSLNQLSQDQKKRIETVKNEYNQLWNSNKRPSKLKLMLGLVPNEGWKPNFRMCLHKMMALSNDDLVLLRKYLGIKNIESLKDDTSGLYNLYLNLGQNCTQSMFFAFRNYLGKRIR